MKTSLLNQLSKEITQGDWCINKKLKAFVEVAKDGQGMTMIADCTDCDDDRPRSEDEANAHAISLTPQLIREVLELREALRQSGEALASALSCINAEDDSRVTYPKTRSQIADAQATRSLLTRHETTDQ